MAQQEENKKNAAVLKAESAETKNPGAEAGENNAKTEYKSPALAWTALAVAVIAWVVLLTSTGYLALALGVVGTVCGFAALHKRSTAARRLAITAIIASMVLVVVLGAFLFAYKSLIG